MGNDALLLGIDGGQTSTKALLAAPDGTVLGRGVGGPFDHFMVAGGAENNRASMRQAVEAALAGHPGATIGTVSLGMTGALRPGEDQVVHEALAGIVPGARVVVQPDYVSNLAGASGGRAGIVLVAGGGAISYGRNAAGEDALAGGYGYMIGDEGSAFDIGRRAITAATQADDRRGPATALLSVVLDHFGLASIRDIVFTVYAAGFSRARISALAPAVTAAAEAGDAVARDIMRSTAAILANTALGVARQLFAADAAVTVYLTGGVFQAGALVLEPFERALIDAWPTATARWPEFPPVAGCLVLAAQADGIATNDAWRERFRASLAAAGDSS